MDSRSLLAEAKGLGPAKSGTDHCIKQRLNAMLLIPLSLWFIASAISIFQYPIQQIPIFMSSPINVGLSFIFIFIMNLLYHGILGMQVIVEDYIHCNMLKNLVMLFIYFTSIFSLVLAFLSIIVLHLFSGLI